MGKVKGQLNELNLGEENALKLYETQHWLDKAEKILKGIRNNSNPAYLNKKVIKYFKEKEKNDEV